MTLYPSQQGRVDLCGGAGSQIVAGLIRAYKTAVDELRDNNRYRRCIYTFCGDHGITEEGVSLYPSVVTREMVKNFVRGALPSTCCVVISALRCASWTQVFPVPSSQASLIAVSGVALLISSADPPCHAQRHFRV